MQNDEPDSSSAQTVPALRRAVGILDILTSGKNLTAGEIAGWNVEDWTSSTQMGERLFVAARHRHDISGSACTGPET